jgi:hypothetical protein
MPKSRIGNLAEKGLLAEDVLDVEAQESLVVYLMVQQRWVDPLFLRELVEGIFVSRSSLLLYAFLDGQGRIQWFTLVISSRDLREEVDNKLACIVRVWV